MSSEATERVDAPSAEIDRIERALERAIDGLVHGSRSRESRALLIEARRLRSVVANWRSIPPAAGVCEEMLARVLALASQAHRGSGQEGAAPSDPPSREAPVVAAETVPESQPFALASKRAAPLVEPVDPPSAPGRAAGDEASRAGSACIAVQTVTLTEPVDPALVVITDPYSPRADAYRTLRRKLFAGGGARAVAVTSARPGERKTTLACNLALALRESARRAVLLVEANAQAPRVGRMLRFDPPECFLAQLARGADEADRPWVVAEPFPKLHVLAIDPHAPRVPLLDPIAFATGMERIRGAGYEHVVIDGPPVLGGASFCVVSDAADGIVFAALTMKSRRREMREAIRELEPAPILGVVVLEG